MVSKTLQRKCGVKLVTQLNTEKLSQKIAIKGVNRELGEVSPHPTRHRRSPAWEECDTDTTALPAEIPLRRHCPATAAARTDGKPAYVSNAHHFIDMWSRNNVLRQARGCQSVSQSGDIWAIALELSGQFRAMRRDGQSNIRFHYVRTPTRKES